eukprot:355267-Chlamydomonas_euryale.AAC.2
MDVHFVGRGSQLPASRLLAGYASVGSIYEPLQWWDWPQHRHTVCLWGWAFGAGMIRCDARPLAELYADVCLSASPLLPGCAGGRPLPVCKLATRQRQHFKHTCCGAGAERALRVLGAC